MDVMASKARDYALGAAWHLRQGLDHYRALEVERSSTYGNPAVVAARAADVSYELAWAASDLERAIPAVAARDASLAHRLTAARAAAQEIVQHMVDRRWAPEEPGAIVQGARDAQEAAQLLA